MSSQKSGNIFYNWMTFKDGFHSRWFIITRVGKTTYDLITLPCISYTVYTVIYSNYTILGGKNLPDHRLQKVSLLILMKKRDPRNNHPMKMINQSWNRSRVVLKVRIIPNSATIRVTRMTTMVWTWIWQMMIIKIHLRLQEHQSDYPVCIYIFCFRWNRYDSYPDRKWLILLEVKRWTIRDTSESNSKKRSFFLRKGHFRPISNPF